MPNWTTNEVTMKGIGNRTELYTDGEFDFNKIVPEPTTKEECIEKYGEDYIDDGTRHLQHGNGDEWFNWYDWHCAFWGTKWGACYTEIFDDDNINFNTAWCEPEPIWKALTEKYRDIPLKVVANYEDGWRIYSTWINGIQISYREVELEWDDEEETYVECEREGEYV